MLSRKALLLVFCCLILSTISPLLYGQATGSFSGTVSDKTGSVIAGATVRVTSQGTATEREAKTDDTGHYLIPLLPIGNYTIRVESQGFQPVEQKDLRLQVDEHRDVNFTMSPASVTSTVEVSATEVAVETTNPTLGQVITSEQVADLPLNGRDFVQLATLTPGNNAGDQSQQLLQRRTRAAKLRRAEHSLFRLADRAPAALTGCSMATTTTS